MEKPNEMTKLKSEEATEEVKVGRRRLIKLGVSVSPVILTLSSRSVLACHCKSPSAGGSLTFNSHRPKHLANWDDPTGFNIQGVKTFQGWIDYGTDNGGNLVNGVKLTTKLQAIPDIGSTPLFNASTTQIKNLSAGFKRDIVTAYLNLCLQPVASTNCLTKLQLTAMTSGTYLDPANNVAWGKVQIRRYLKDNWLLG